MTLVMLAGIAAVNMNIILPSLPALAIHFDTDYALVQLALSAYLFATAFLQIFIGPLSDRYGRRPIILVSTIVFIAASLITALATSFEMYMVGRILQTSIATGIVLSRAIVRDMVPMEKAASMIGYVTMGMALMPMLAPMFGGILQDLYNWQAVNYFTAFIGAFALILFWLDIGETNKHKSSSFAAQFSEYPELLSSRRFWGYSFSTMFASGAYFAFLGGAPFIAEHYYDITPSALGAYMASLGVGYIAGNFISGRYSQHLGIAKMMYSGAIIASIAILISMFLVILEIKHPAVFFVPLAGVGLGNGMTIPSCMAGIVSVKPTLAGSASGLGGAIMIGGGAALSVFAGLVLDHNSSPIPLLLVMLGSALLGVMTVVYTNYIEKTIANAAS